MAAKSNLTPKKDWESSFLIRFRETGNVRASCDAAGISRQTAYHRRDHNPEFAQLWDDAAEDAADALELIARERAATVSDTLLIFLLKGLRPSKYRERVSQEVSGPAGGPIEIDANGIRDDLQRRMVRLAAAGSVSQLPGDAEPGRT